MRGDQTWTGPLSTDAPDGNLPWIPDSTSGAIEPALAGMLAATALIVAFEVIQNREKREMLRRYCLARHRVVRAGFYRFFRRS